MDPKSIISVQIPDAVDAFLAKEAKRRLTSKSAVIRGILADHLRQLGVDPLKAEGIEHPTEDVPA